MEIENVVIEFTSLGLEEYGFLAAVITKGNGFGVPFRCTIEKDVPAFIKGVCEVVGVKTWEKLPGKHCRVRLENREAVAIGNIVKDEWCNRTGDIFNKVN